MTDGQKFDILDYFTPRVRNVGLELMSSCERMESMRGLVLKVGTQVLNLLWASVIFDIFLILRKNVNIEKVIFKMKIIFIKKKQGGKPDFKVFF